MYVFQPTIEIKETAKNAKRFVDENAVELWNIFYPLIPFVAGLYMLDIILAELFLDKPKGVMFKKDVFGNYSAVSQTKKMGVGVNLIALYFYFVFTVSWMRVSLKGAGQGIMQPLKPSRIEAKLFGTLFLVGLCIGIALIVGAIIVAQAGKLALLLYVCFAGLFFFYACIRLNFYFAAKSIGDNITLSQAYALADGYVWKIIASSFLANLKLLGLMFIYIFCVHLCLGFAEKNIFDAHTVHYQKFLLSTLPAALYFTPLIYAHSTAVVANYYRYATQNVVMPHAENDKSPRRKLDAAQRERAREREKIKNESLF